MTTAGAASVPSLRTRAGRSGTAGVSSIGVRRLRSSVRDHASAGASGNCASPGVHPPALLTRTSAPPRSRARAASIRTSPSSVRSACTTNACTRAARTRSAVASAASRSRSATTTRTPSRARPTASSRPRPDPAPVTTASFQRSRSGMPGTLAPTADGDGCRWCGRRLADMRPVTDLERRVAPFKVESDYQPSGDQPTAIAEISKRIQGGVEDVVLLGATGTGKTATVAWVAEQLQRPVLVMQPNKTLAAQFANELRQLFPHNAIEYFVSYYDYYQPEAYVPQTDTYIEKDSSINEEVERLRHSATNSPADPPRRDRGVDGVLHLRPRHPAGVRRPDAAAARSARSTTATRSCAGWSQIQYTRNDMTFTRGTFRVRGDTLEIFPVYEELAIRIEFFGDEIERLMTLHPVTGEVLTEDQELHIFPATHYVAGPERMERAIAGIEAELEEQLATFERQGKLLEAQRLRMRTTYDIEMMRQVGSCSGHRELLDAHRRPEPGERAQLPARLLPRGLPARRRRVPRRGAPDRRHVRGRHVPQAQPGRPRLPAAERDGQPAAAVGGVPRPDRPDHLPLGHARQLRARQGRGRRGAADHPADRPDRPRGRREVDQGPDRRPDPRDQHPRRQGASGCWSRR